ncbi:hypothetical protein [Massilia violaceinigra]|uniref:hypothetical protein n=1 Tax=Massilia violaceinigra TaxID=2045208 RepID=UPI0012FE372A|nr:hypothetical protein [Massilia violaceinigra]
MAQLAARQLALERQEGQPPALQADYWEPVGDGVGLSGVNASAPEHRGVTGSARLQQHIQQLDQWAFDTNKKDTSVIQDLFPCAACTDRCRTIARDGRHDIQPARALTGQ